MILWILVHISQLVPSTEVITRKSLNIFLGWISLPTFFLRFLVCSSRFNTWAISWFHARHLQGYGRSAQARSPYWLGIWRQGWAPPVEKLDVSKLRFVFPPQKGRAWKLNKYCCVWKKTEIHLFLIFFFGSIYISECMSVFFFCGVITEFFSHLWQDHSHLPNWSSFEVFFEIKVLEKAPIRENLQWGFVGWFSVKLWTQKGRNLCTLKQKKMIYWWVLGAYLSIL